MTDAATEARLYSHQCCQNTPPIEARSTLGSWGWRLIVGSPPLSIAIAFCPWCGVELPEIESGTPRLKERAPNETA